MSTLRDGKKGSGYLAWFQRCEGDTYHLRGLACWQSEINTLTGDDSDDGHDGDDEDALSFLRWRGMPRVTRFMYVGPGFIIKAG